MMPLQSVLGWYGFYDRHATSLVRIVSLPSEWLMRLFC